MRVQYSVMLSKQSSSMACRYGVQIHIDDEKQVEKCVAWRDAGKIPYLALCMGSVHTSMYLPLVVVFFSSFRSFELVAKTE